MGTILFRTQATRFGYKPSQPLVDRHSRVCGYSDIGLRRGVHLLLLQTCKGEGGFREDEPGALGMRRQ